MLYALLWYHLFFRRNKMKLKGNYFFTQKEDVKDEESISANLLVRSGMIKKVPYGIKSFKKY